MGTVLARLRRARVRYGDVDALHDVSLDLTAGSQLAVLGPSGAGKSTLLRLLTRELAPDSGSIEWSSSGLREGVVRQQPLLFDWLTIRENVALGQQFRANHVDQALVGELMDLLGIASVAHSYPDQVSGGQAQRASFARALAIRPNLLILDEPFSALDPATRADLQLWLRRELTERRLSSVLVTHDLDEALVLADDIVMIAAGRVTHHWANPEPAADQAAALHHPLRRGLRAAYADVASAARGQTRDLEDPGTAQGTEDRTGSQAEDQVRTQTEGRTGENRRAAS